MTTWRELTAIDPALTAAGRQLLLNCAPTWGVALFGTLRPSGAPRISPLCVYIVDDRLVVTIDGWKEKDLARDPRYSLHTYWSEGQDEFAVNGSASDALEDDDLARLVDAEPRLRWSPIVRELHLDSAHVVIYRNFPGPGMYAEVAAWTAGAATRRWTRDEPTPEDTITASA